MSHRNRPRFGSGFEVLEGREVPAIITFNVNTTNDTPWVVGNNQAKDAAGNVSLRSVVGTRTRMR